MIFFEANFFITQKLEQLALNPTIDQQLGGELG